MCDMNDPLNEDEMLPVKAHAELLAEQCRSSNYQSQRVDHKTARILYISANISFSLIQLQLRYQLRTAISACIPPKLPMICSCSTATTTTVMDFYCFKHGISWEIHFASGAAAQDVYTWIARTYSPYSNGTISLTVSAWCKVIEANVTRQSFITHDTWVRLPLFCWWFSCSQPSMTLETTGRLKREQYCKWNRPL